MTVSPYQALIRTTCMGGQVQHYGWTYQGQTATIDYETLSAGPTSDV